MDASKIAKNFINCSMMTEREANEIVVRIFLNTEYADYEAAITAIANESKKIPSLVPPIEAIEDYFAQAIRCIKNVPYNGLPIEVSIEKIELKQNLEGFF